MKPTGNSIWVPGALTPPKGLTPPRQPDVELPQQHRFTLHPALPSGPHSSLKSSWRVWKLYPFPRFQSWLHTSGMCSQPRMKMPVARIIMQINLWMCFGRDYLEWVHWWGKNHPKCGWHHSMDWDPRLRKAKWAEAKDPSLSGTWLMQQWDQPSPSLCHAGLDPLEHWAEINLAEVAFARHFVAVIRSN